MQNLNNGKLKKIIGKNFDLWLDGGHNIHASEILFTEIDKWKKFKNNINFGNGFWKRSSKVFKKNC